jgi:hypothetical protein
MPVLNFPADFLVNSRSFSHAGAKVNGVPSQLTFLVPKDDSFPVVTAWRQDGEFCVGSPSAFSDEKSRSVSEAPALEKQRAG